MPRHRVDEVVADDRIPGVALEPLPRLPRQSTHVETVATVDLEAHVLGEHCDRAVKAPHL